MMQRFGTVIDRRPLGSGHSGRVGTYVVRDSETGEEYTYSYADVVTEGFRSALVGERVRFLIDPDLPNVATYVVRLDLPGVEAHYP
jgi:hypothetical protein